MTDPQDTGWVVVARFAGFDCDSSADIAVGVLQSCDIPALRFPGKAGMIYDGALGGLQPVKVFVPKEKEAEAKAILAGEAPEAADDGQEGPAEGD